MISISDFRRRVAELDGMRLETEKNKKGFSIRVLSGSLEFTPESSGIPRRQSWGRIERVLDRYNETHSLVPGHYQDITVAGSYLTVILQRLRLENRS